jgi:hypothetical protein
MQELVCIYKFNVDDLSSDVDNFADPPKRIYCIPKLITFIQLSVSSEVKELFSYSRKVTHYIEFQCSVSCSQG